MNSKKKSTTKSIPKDSTKKSLGPKKIQTPSLRDEICESMLKDLTFSPATQYPDIQYNELASAILQVIVSDIQNKQKSLYQVIEGCNDQQHINTVVINFLQSKIPTFIKLLQNYINSAESMKERIVCLKWLRSLCIHHKKHFTSELEHQNERESDLLKLKGKIQMISL